MNIPKKWFLRSKTFWINLAVALLMSQIKVEGQIGELIRDLHLEDFKEYVFALVPAINILLRFMSWREIGLNEESRPLYKSKTVLINFAIFIGAGVLLYIRIRDGYNLWTPIILMVVSLANIYLRVTFTRVRITLLPWPINFI